MLRSLLGRARSSAMARRMRLSSKREPFQSGEEALGRQEAVVERLDGERVGEALDAQRHRLAALRERARVGGREGGGEALAQPVPGGVQREHARGVEADVDFAGVEEQDLGRALLHDDRRIVLRVQLVLGRELAQHQPPEPAFE
jgi:hypothetical protein